MNKITKSLILLLILLIYVAVTHEIVWPQQEDTITLTKEEYDELTKYLENLQILENATPTIKLDEYIILFDNKGRVYAKDRLTGTLTLGYKVYGLDVELPLLINRKDPSSGFKFEIKQVNILGIGKKDTADLKVIPSVGFLFQFYRTKQLVFSIVGTTDVLGLGLGIDFGKRTNLLLGAGYRYSESIAGFIGVSFELF